MPRKPEAQMVQEETDTLPLAIVEIPEGHEVQMDAPAPAYEPAAHALHDGLLLFPHDHELSEDTLVRDAVRPMYPGEHENE